MPSRREFRTVQQHSTAVPKHWLSTLVGIIAAVVLMVCLFVHSTVLNQQFMSTEVVHSSMAKQVKNDINASLSSYGIDEQIVTTKQTNKLLTQGIKQIYQGKPVKLNFASVLGGLEDRADNTLAGYGLPESLISQLPTGSLNSQISATLNSRINGTQVQQVENAIKTGNRITIAGIMISVVILVLVAVRDLFSRTVLRDFRWITLISGLIMVVLILMIQPLVQSYSADLASFQNVIKQITADTIKVGWQMVAVDLTLAVVLWLVSFIFHRQKA